jgi:drug/metabolite transporter (DMT)-like permease
MVAKHRNKAGRRLMHGATKSIGLILIAVVLMAYANVMLKLRITALDKDSSISWLSCALSMMLDPWTWSALVAAIVTGLLYVIALRQLELSVVEPLFALVFVVVPLAAVLILGEHLSPVRIVGLILIFVGVILVGQTA